MDKVFVTAKVNPDLDGTACTLAYADLLRRTGMDSTGLITGSPQSEVGYFMGVQGISVPTRSDEVSDQWDSYVLVDASSIKGMPRVVRPDRVTEVIDHRTGEPQKEFPHARIQNELIGAAATLVVERFIQAHVQIQPDHAKLLYGAIYHNTLNFISSNTSSRDKDAAGFLESAFALDAAMAREMFDYSTREVEEDVQVALENDAKEFGTGWKVGAYQLIVWGSGVFRHRKDIESAVRILREGMHAQWSFVNIVDLESRQSHLFVTGQEGSRILSQALGVEFTDGWSVLPKALLRKQIMPRVNEVVGAGR